VNRAALVAPLLIAVSACHHAAPSQEELLETAPNQTRQFFALAEGGDCKALAPLLAHPETCDSMVEEFKRTHTHLSSIVGTKIDGRDPMLVLVTVDAPSTKFDHTFVVRVKWTEAGWKVAL
jgi:hypothetical protein